MNKISYDDYYSIISPNAKGFRTDHLGYGDPNTVRNVCDTISTILSYTNKLGLDQTDIMWCLRTNYVYCVLSAFDFSLDNAILCLQNTLSVLHRDLLGVMKTAEDDGSFSELQSKLLSPKDFLLTNKVLNACNGNVLLGMQLALTLTSARFGCDESFNFCEVEPYANYAASELITCSDTLIRLRELNRKLTPYNDLVGYMSFAASLKSNFIIVLLYGVGNLYFKSVQEKLLGTLKEDYVAQVLKEKSAFSGKPRPDSPKRHEDLSQMEKMRAQIMKIAEQVRDTTDKKMKDNLRDKADKLKFKVNQLWLKWARDKKNTPYSLD